MSKIYVSAVVLLLSELLPLFGVTFATERLTSLVQAVVLLVTGSIILISRYQQGDINLLGARK